MNEYAAGAGVSSLHARSPIALHARDAGPDLLPRSRVDSCTSARDAPHIRADVDGETTTALGLLGPRSTSRYS